VPYVAEQNNLTQDMPTPCAEGHSRQISRSDSQDGIFCCQYHGRDYARRATCRYSQI